MGTPPSYRVEVDTDSLDLLVDILGESVDEFLDELRDEVEWTWRRLAAPALNSSRREYLDNLSVTREGDDIVMSLTGDLATAVETGQQSFDLKPGFLKGAKYRVIPLVSDRGPVKFRTVSHTSKGWKHPGITPRNIIPSVQNELQSGLIGEVFSRVLSRSKI